MDEINTKLSALQYVLEILIATTYRHADVCEREGKRIAQHALAASPNLPPGAGPIDLDACREQIRAIASETQRIFENAAQRIRDESGRNG